jgi:DNA-binding transcriptional LysR family regulator
VPHPIGQRHVTPLVTGFLVAHPAVRMELHLSDRNLDLVEEGLDVAVRIGALPDSGLVARRVGEVRRVLVASPGYLAARGTPTSPADLAAYDAVFTASRPAPFEWRFRGPGGKEHVVRLAPPLVVSHVEAALSAALEGHGVATALSYQVDAEVGAGRLVRLLPEHEPPPVPVQLVVPSARHMPARVRLFLDHAAARLGQLEVIRPERWGRDGPGA